MRITELKEKKKDKYGKEKSGNGTKKAKIQER